MIFGCPLKNFSFEKKRNVCFSWGIWFVLFGPLFLGPLLVRLEIVQFKIIHFLRLLYCILSSLNCLRIIENKTYSFITTELHEPRWAMKCI